MILKKTKNMKIFRQLLLLHLFQGYLKVTYLFTVHIRDNHILMFVCSDLTLRMKHFGRNDLVHLYDV